jgi:hypothetical protein
MIPNWKKISDSNSTVFSRSNGVISSSKSWSFQHDFDGWSLDQN